MKITRIKVDVTPSADKNTVAEVMIVLDDSLVIHSIKIKKINDSLFVCMPTSNDKKGKKMINGKKVPWDVVHPTNRVFNEYLNDKILEEYNAVISN